MAQLKMHTVDQETSKKIQKVYLKRKHTDQADQA